MGKRADLILVDGSPLANISDLRKVSWVVANGLLYDKGSSGGVSGSTHNFGGRGFGSVNSTATAAEPVQQGKSGSRRY